MYLNITFNKPNLLTTRDLSLYCNRSFAI